MEKKKKEMQSQKHREIPENTFIAGLHDGVPIGLGYLSVSFTFGIMAQSMGIPFVWTLLISMTNLTPAESSPPALTVDAVEKNTDGMVMADRTA